MGVRTEIGWDWVAVAPSPKSGKLKRLGVNLGQWTVCPLGIVKSSNQTKMGDQEMTRERDAGECRARAAEFERLADEATNPAAREILTTIADRWATLAEKDVANSGGLSQ
jgi:hypothetical protein